MTEKLGTCLFARLRLSADPDRLETSPAPALIPMDLVAGLQDSKPFVRAPAQDARVQLHEEVEAR